MSLAGLSELELELLELVILTALFFFGVHDLGFGGRDLPLTGVFSTAVAFTTCSSLLVTDCRSSALDLSGAGFSPLPLNEWF